MKNKFLNSVLAIFCFSFNLSAMAEDIDLFVGAPVSTSDAPNVLIIVDNTANWTAAFANEMAALASVVNGLPVDKFRVGLMMFTESGGGNTGNDGAYVRAAIRPMNAGNKIKYKALVDSLDSTADKSNGGKIGMSMREAYLYYSGGVPHAGNNKNKTDYTGSTSGTAPDQAIYLLAGNALLSKTGTAYVNPAVVACAKNYIIYISNGAAQDNSSDTTLATAALAAAGGSTVTIPISPSGSQSNIADEWARFMKKSSLDIRTYTVDINKVTSGQGPGWTALLRSMANVSSGKYFDITSTGTQIADTLNGIFSEIQSVNSVFSSVSLPVSVNTQGTFLNQVYIGMFRPDPDSYPRWNGNLKQYKLGYASGSTSLQLLDAGNARAINSTTGFIGECARSFWTPTVLDTYWAFRPLGTCLTANSDVSNFPDGNIVEKGAQGYMLRSTTTRTVKTCSPTSCTALTDFNNTNVTQTMLGAASIAHRDTLINWQLGQDLQDENLNGITTAEMRASAHGDVVHSRPVAINYGTDAAPSVVVFYGGNDGVLRAVNGNRLNSIGTAAAGSELWGFVPPEFYPKIKRIYDNTTTISFPGHTTGTPTPLPKDYGFDGPVTAYKNGSTSLIFAAMRRGGKALYSIDVSAPATPVLKWKKGTSDLIGLGQTWSSPKILNAAGYGAGASPMLIMGGGYDACHDTDGNTNGCGTEGKKIYVVDANTGALLKSFDTDSSVISDITVINDSTTGYAKYAYTADLGGNVYRISGASANLPIGTTAPGSWTITKIAAMGGSGINNRKFMFAPDVIEINGSTYGILLGSGDREKPLVSFTAATAVTNRFYMIQDQPESGTWLSAENATCAANVICNGSLFAITTTATPSASDLASKKGWYLALAATEQVVTSAITVFDTVTFSTHMPQVTMAGTCSTLGVATVYNINYKNAAATGDGRGATIVGGGLPPSPIAGMVTLDDGTTVPFIIGSNPNSSLEGGAPPPPPSAVRPKSRAYWNIKK